MKNGVYAGLGVLMGVHLLLAQEIVAPYVDTIPLRDPSSAIWKQARPVTLKLLPQNIIPPHLPQQTVGEITVRALYSDLWVALLVEWKDPTRDVYTLPDGFPDQVAVQFPVRLNGGAPPSFMMGNPGGRVHIVQWKALWQEDVEQGYVSQRDIYPNMWVDQYWFVDAPQRGPRREVPPYPPDIEDFTDPRAFEWIPGYQAHNPDITFVRREPVREFTAEGFGTLAPQQIQEARGWGIYDPQTRTWRVVIAVPRVSEDANNTSFSRRNFVSFAVWNGSAHDRGSRKAYVPWVPLILEGMP